MTCTDRKSIRAEDILEIIRASDAKNLDKWFHLMEYHEKRMEVRRGLALRMFISLLVLYLLLLNGAVEHQQVLKDLFVPLSIFVIAMLVLFLVYIVAIESMNWRDRQVYSPLLATLDLHLIGATKQETAEEPVWKTVLGSWAGTWPAIVAICFAVATLWVLYKIL